MNARKIVVFVGFLAAIAGVTNLAVGVQDKKDAAKSKKAATPSLKVTKAEVSQIGRGILTVEGEFDLRQDDAKNAKVVVAVVHPSVGGVTEGVAEVRAKGTRGTFVKQFSGPEEQRFNHALGGYKVKVFLSAGRGMIAETTADVPHTEAVDAGKAPKPKKPPPNSSISFDKGSPTSGKSDSTCWIRGQGTYDPGKSNSEFPLAIVSVRFKARNIKTLQLYSTGALFDTGAWTGQIAPVEPGDYGVWCELVTSPVGDNVGYTASATATVRITVKE